MISLSRFWMKILKSLNYKRTSRLFCPKAVSSTLHFQASVLMVALARMALMVLTVKGSFQAVLPGKSYVKHPMPISILSGSLLAALAMLLVQHLP